MRAAEVLKVQVEVREELLNGGHKVINEGVVAILVNALVALTQVQRVIEQLLAVGAGVNDNRHDAVWINASCSGVNHELTDGNFDAVGAPVADAQNCLCVGDDNQVNVSACGCVLQRGLEVLRVIGRQEACVLRVNVALGVLLNVRCDSWIVNDRHELFDVL